MARYIREEILNQPEDFVNFMMNDFLSKHGFRYVQFKGEMIYRAGDGFFEIPKFFIWSYRNGVIHVEAWTRNVWLPGVYGKENALTGFFGSIPKSAYKGDVEQLLQLLHQPVGQQQYAQTNGAPQMQQGAPQGTNGPIPVQGIDTSRYAKMALAFGIVGLVLFCIPYVGIMFGILALIYANKGKTSVKKGMATAGMVCGILAIAIAVIIIILNVIGYAGYAWMM